MKTVSDLLRDADPLSDDALCLDEARESIRRRVISAASVARPPVSHRRIVIGAAGSLAAVTAVALLVGFGDRGTLRAAVRFEVRLAELQPAPGLIVARVGESERLIYLHPELIVTNDDIAQSWVTRDGPDRFSISVEFLEPGAQRMRQATSAHVGRPVAILIDGAVAIAPVVRSAISNSATITGNYSQSEAERIAEGIGTR
jgi:preprotein translocase subunit SecD